jgi:catechol 2,3-dioxygenase-like lactoylglutathione lyase family enzyme
MVLVRFKKLRSILFFGFIASWLGIALLGCDGQGCNPAPVPLTTVHFNSHWLPGGENVAEIESTAAFYKAVLGLQETRRYGTGLGNQLGISLNFGESPEQARVQPGPDFGIAASVDAPPADDFIRATLHPTDIAACAARAQANGGLILSDEQTGVGARIVRFRDPAGNVIELSPAPAYLAPATLMRLAWRIPATNAEAVARFYEAVLDLREVARGGTPTAPDITLKFGATAEQAAGSSHPARLTIVSVDQLPPLRLVTDAAQIVFGMLSNAELNEIVRRAEENGSDIVLRPITISVISSTFARFTDPAGNIVEIVYNPNLILPPVR